ncbi:MAG: hypothetical protein JWM16_623 [Verrucomicrobiales bacterium]|nr:hypothetical protein [Verrucomicrobiales bacterium]
MIFNPFKSACRHQLIWATGSAAVLLLGLLIFAKPLLCLQRGAARGEVIIVLGGESVLRAEKALELFNAGASKAIIVSGDGHKGDIETYLLLNGVPASAISLEPNSQNTKENAEFTCAILKSNDVKSAIIVTSWFHSRRSLACFEHFAPSIRFSSLPTMKHEPLRSEWSRVFKEYLKIVWYVFRYQIPPWT